MTALLTAIVLSQAGLFLLMLTFLVSYLKNRHELLRFSSVKVTAPVDASVAVVVPARNEQAKIHIGLRSLAASRGLTHLKIFAVNDRSKDRTGPAIADEATRHPSLIEPVTIESLPIGWLGKTNACWQGATRASASQYILFTDADVLYHEDTLAEAVTLMQERRLDFLTAFPRAEYHGPWEAAFLMFFGFILSMASRPWSLSNPEGRNHLGIGAFMMVRTEAYFRVGGHQPLKYEVADDIKLGLLFRSQGLRCAAIDGSDRIRLRWQNGLWASLGGILKNAFSGFEYSWLKVTAACAFLASLFLVPWLSVGAGTMALLGWSAPLGGTAGAIIAAIEILGALNLGLLLFSYRTSSQATAFPWVTGFLLSPVIVILSIGTFITSAALTCYRGGVQWRETFYVLGDLKKQCFTMRKAYRAKRELTMR